ncbi:GNAT family N-acetyltransferase [Gorillibacterium sp. CAU 1737]|uniref:GNAT family N-acetyltransferase n=1 Tax=Gorillibacterium sp. CAU 1737 TaxID=3140362 RepID=UPI0032610DA2
MKGTIESEVCRFVSLISTDAANYVQSGFANHAVTLVHYEDSPRSQGAFCVVENEDCIIAYAVFSRYHHDEALITLMANSLQRHLSPSETREVCFNVYGRNTEIIQLAQSLGFATDMEGFHLQYDFAKEVELPEITPLVEKGFSPDRLEEFLHLFDKAYYPLKVENGWSTEPSPKDQFLQSMLSYAADDRVRSFWIEDTLIGAYVIAGEYIRDFVILPDYQNQGYGSRMLNHCIHRMANTMGMKRIFLRVAKSNSGAKRFYERNHFVERSHFAEHTFVSK